jgi:hypothetical protein
MITSHATFNRKNAYWFSLTESINNKLRAKDSSIPTITSIQSMLLVLLLHYAGLLPFWPLKDSVFGVTVEEVSSFMLSTKCMNLFCPFNCYSIPFLECERNGTNTDNSRTSNERKGHSRISLVVKAPAGKDL